MEFSTNRGKKTYQEAFLIVKGMTFDTFFLSLTLVVGKKPVGNEPLVCHYYVIF